MDFLHFYKILFYKYGTTYKNDKISYQREVKELKENLEAVVNSMEAFLIIYKDNKKIKLFGGVREWIRLQTIGLNHLKQYFNE